MACDLATPSQLTRASGFPDEIFSKGWAILRYDFRGHGRSEASIRSSCDVGTLADDLVALMDLVGAERVCHVGVSMERSRALLRQLNILRGSLLSSCVMRG